jgi:hypothetical protein
MQDRGKCTGSRTVLVDKSESEIRVANIQLGVLDAEDMKERGARLTHKRLLSLLR